jgi:hypothetical protein
MSNYVLTPQAVRKLRGALAANPGNTGASGAPSPVNIDDYPPPFTVRWSASERGGLGSWCIWLPDASHLVRYGSQYLTIDTQYSLVPATKLPSGWFTSTGIPQTGNATVWLNVTQTTVGGIFVYVAPTPASPSQTVTVIATIKIADMLVDAATGARRVQQCVDSLVTLGGEGGGSVALDDTSTDWNTGNQVQVKDWDTGTPASSTTIAQDIHNGNTTAQGAVVERTTGGALQYKKPGTLAQLLGSSVTFSNKTILTGWGWNTTTHKIEISTAVISVANGVITSWIDQQVQTIDTTPITSIVN